MKSKPKKCTKCGREDLPWFSNKMCVYCAKKEYKPLKKTPLKLRAKKTPNEEKQKLTIFFNEMIKKFQEHPYCTETGEYIGEITRLHCAHGWPKRKYKSVATDPDNIVLLSWSKHTELDKYLDTNDFKSLEEKFRSWPIIRERMKNLLPKITEQGNLRIKFEEYLKNSI